MELYQTKKFWHSEANYQQNKKTVYWMEEDIHQWYSWSNKMFISETYKELIELKDKTKA